jgi:hypothetical protein
MFLPSMMPGMFIYNKNELLPQVSYTDTSIMQYLRRQQGESFLDQLQKVETSYYCNRQKFIIFI